MSANETFKQVFPLEKASSFNYFLLLMAFLLSLDIALGLFYQKNILAFGQSFPTSEYTIGSAIFFFVAFSFVLSLLFPAVRFLLDHVIGLIYFKWFYKSDYSTHNRERAYKDETSVMRDAILTCNEFDYKRALEHNEALKQKESVLELAFSISLLLIIDLIVGIHNTPSIIQKVIIYIDSIKNNNYFLHIIAILSGYLFLGVIGFLAWQSINPIDDNRMYLPKPNDNKSELMPGSSMEPSITPPPDIYSS